MNLQPSKRCKYCNVDYPAEEPRCARCYGRLESLAPAPVLTAATLPRTERREDRPAPPPPPPVLKVAAANPHVKRAPRVSERQRELFPPEESSKIVELPAQRRRTLGEGKRAASKKKTNPNQFSFEFVEMPEPRQPLRREFDSARSPFKVAPLARRAAAAIFDLGIVAAMAGLYAATLHWLGKWAIGASLLRVEWWPYLAAALPLIAFAYKFLWCVGRRDPIGVEAMGLRLVSFDGAAPTPGQRTCRLLTGWLGLGGAGIGLGWAIFDQEKLTWHDHASQTFLTPAERDEE